MCVFSQPEVEKPKPPPEPLKLINEGQRKAREDALRRAKVAKGLSGTIATSPLGVPGAAPTAGKTMLGQ